jgi:hypothetical protein
MHNKHIYAVKSTLVVEYYELSAPQQSSPRISHFKKFTTLSDKCVCIARAVLGANFGGATIRKYIHAAVCEQNVLLSRLRQFKYFA